MADPVPFNPWRPVPQRPPRRDDPSKWSCPSYRDIEAEEIVGRLSKEMKK